MENSWQSIALTDVGCRRKENQDAVYADDNRRLWAVSDGMGGHAEGAAASQAVVRALSELMLSDHLGERIVQIQQALRKVNSQLFHYAANDLRGQQTGATVVVLTECHGLAATIWAGDSRCYRVKEKQLIQLSWDHSHLREMVRDGHMTEQEAEVSKLSNVITRAIGPHQQVFFDFIVFRSAADDHYLLCSDGLTNELSDSEILNILLDQKHLKASAEKLIYKTLHKGARDNVSVVLAMQGNAAAAKLPEDAPVTGWNHHFQELNKAFYHGNIDEQYYYQHLEAVLPSPGTAQKAIPKPIAQPLSRASTLEVKLVSPQGAEYSSDKVTPESKKMSVVFVLIIIAIALVVLFTMLGG